MDLVSQVIIQASAILLRVRFVGVPIPGAYIIVPLIFGNSCLTLILTPIGGVAVYLPGRSSRNYLGSSIELPQGLVRVHLQVHLPRGSKYPMVKDSGLKAIKGMVFAAKGLNYWVLGMSGLPAAAVSLSLRGAVRYPSGGTPGFGPVQEPFGSEDVAPHEGYIVQVNPAEGFEFLQLHVAHRSPMRPYEGLLGPRIDFNTWNTDVGRFMLVLLLRLCSDQRTVVFQLSGFYVWR